MSELLVRGSFYPRGTGSNAFWTERTFRPNLSRVSKPIKSGISASTMSVEMGMKEPRGVGILLFIDPNERLRSTPKR
jgi:hypothetical protein